MRSFVVSLICLFLTSSAFGYTVDAVKVESGNITTTPNVSTSVSADTVNLAFGAKPLGNSLSIYSVYIVPSRDNTAEVWIGDSSLDIGKGFLLVSGSSVRIETSNLSNIWVTSNTATTNQKVSFITSNQ